MALSDRALLPSPATMLPIPVLLLPLSSRALPSKYMANNESVPDMPPVLSLPSRQALPSVANTELVLAAPQVLPPPSGALPCKATKELAPETPLSGALPRRKAINKLALAASEESPVPDRALPRKVVNILGTAASKMSLLLGRALPSKYMANNESVSNAPPVLSLPSRQALPSVANTEFVLAALQVLPPPSGALPRKATKELAPEPPLSGALSRKTINKLAPAPLPSGDVPLKAPQESAPFVNLRNEWENLSESRVHLSDMQQDRALGTKPVIAWMKSCETFSPGSLRRAANKMTSGTISANKPSSLDAQGLVEAYPSVFEFGRNPLPPGTSMWDPEKFLGYHRLICARCRSESSESGPHASCYFYKMYMILRNGWNPRRKPEQEAYLQKKAVSASEARDINHPGWKDFPDNATKSIDKWMSSGVLRKVPEGARVVVNPCNIVVKKSDFNRALALVNIRITCQATLDAANADSRIQPKIKTRTVTDCTASGANDCFDPMPFSMSTADDALRILTPNCVMGKQDIEGYYTTFSLAEEFMYLMGAFLNGELLVFGSCGFGSKPAPLFSSAFSAEICSYSNLVLRIPTVAIMDDFFLTSALWATTQSYLDNFEALIADLARETNGARCVKDKREIGTTLPFVGITFDSIRMTLTMGVDQAMATSQICLQYSNTISEGLHIAHGEWHSFAGKLQWLAFVLLEGRLRLTYVWQYKACLQRRSTFGPASEALRSLLLIDLAWWASVLSAWAARDLSGRELPILLWSELIKEPGAITHLQTDASGETTEGHGGFFGDLNTPDPLFLALRNTNLDIASSQHIELIALRSLLQEVAQCRPSTKLILWISDAQAAVYSLNNGKSDSDPSRDVIRDILALCDSMRWQIVGLWLERSHNTIADFLSHLASLVNQESVRGHLSDL